MRNSSGYTLLELLIVVVIVGIFTGAALPSLSTLNQNWQVRGAANKLEQAVRQTRALAMSKDQTTVLCLGTPGGSAVSYTIVTGSCATPATTLASDSLPTNVTASLSNYCNTSSPYLLQFTSRGRLDTTPCSTGFSINLSTSTYPTIQLSYTGNTAVTVRNVYILSLLGKVTTQ